MPIWLTGLATRASATRAVKWGGIACFIQASRIVLGMIVQLSASEKSIGQAVAWTVGAGVVPALVLVAGFSLWRGGGRASGTLTVLLLTAETAFYTPAMSSMTIPMVGSLAVRLALFFVIANGVRGAFALSHADYDGEVREVFK